MTTGTATRPALPLSALPRRAGVGFKPEHAAAVLAGGHDGAWFEVHAENYMGEGGPALAMLGELRAAFPLSLHGVGLSLGGPAPRLDPAHLARLKHLVVRPHHAVTIAAVSSAQATVLGALRAGLSLMRAAEAAALHDGFDLGAAIAALTRDGLLTAIHPEGSSPA